MTTAALTRRRTPVLLNRALWTVVALLVLIGVAAAIGRGVYPADFGTHADSLRGSLMDAFHGTDPFALQRPEEIRRFDGRFAAHPFLTMLHIGPGALFLLLASFQFSSRIRRRHLRVHRWSGRLLIALAFLAALPALYFGIFVPIGGLGERIAVALFGGLFLVAICRAFVAIRKKQVAVHREWMIRAFALALAISTVRIVGAFVDFTLTPAGFRPSEIFVISLWIGWATTLGAAELWIRYTRPMGISA